MMQEIISVQQGCSATRPLVPHQSFHDQNVDQLQERARVTSRWTSHVPWD